VSQPRTTKLQRELLKLLCSHGYDATIEPRGKHFGIRVNSGGKCVFVTVSGSPKDCDTAKKQVLRDVKRSM
jgi:hypothetical protein